MANTSKARLSRVLLLVTLTLAFGVYFAVRGSARAAKATNSDHAPSAASVDTRYNAGLGGKSANASVDLAAAARDAESARRRAQSLAERTAVERRKQEYQRQPAEPQELSPEFKANPDLYEAGPGPHLARYGGRSGALSVHAQPDDAEVTTVLESEGPFPKLAVWVPSFRVSSGAEVTIHARLVGEDGQGLVAESVSATIVEKQTGQSHQHTLVATAPGNYNLVFKPPAPSSSIGLYEYAVFAVTRAADGAQQVRSAQGAFQVHSAVARVLSTEAAAERKGGNIELALPVQIESAGDYTFYAELWGGDDGAMSVAFGMDKGENLARGRYVAKITFGGLVIKDRAVNGPYVVRNVRVRQVSAFPFVEADPVPVLLKTPAWEAETFQ